MSNTRMVIFALCTESAEERYGRAFQAAERACMHAKRQLSVSRSCNMFTTNGIKRCRRSPPSEPEFLPLLLSLTVFLRRGPSQGPEAPPLRPGGAEPGGSGTDQLLQAFNVSRSLLQAKPSDLIGGPSGLCCLDSGACRLMPANQPPEAGCGSAAPLRPCGCAEPVCMR